MRRGAAESGGQRRKSNRRGVPSGSADAQPPDRIHVFINAFLDHMTQLWLVPLLLVPPLVFLANPFFGWFEPSVGLAVGFFVGYYPGMLLLGLISASWQTTREFRCQQQDKRGAIDAE